MTKAQAIIKKQQQAFEDLVKSLDTEQLKLMRDYIDAKWEYEGLVKKASTLTYQSPREILKAAIEWSL